MKLLSIVALLTCFLYVGKQFCLSAQAQQISRNDTLTIGRDTRFNREFSETNQKGWYGNAEVSPVDGVVSVINMNVAKPGAVTLAIGLIDQNNYVIVEREFVRKVVSGLNQLVVSEPIRSGQQVFVKMPASGIRYFKGAGGKIQYTQKGYSATLSTLPDAYLSLSYRIDSAPTSKLVSSSLGNKTITSKRAYKNVLIIGNSITRHGLAAYWWGNWGMAASTREHDFVHVLVGLLRQQNSSMNFSVLQAANWERNHENFALSAYDTAFARSPDLVIIRLGENVQDVANYEKSYLNLLTYIQQKVPTATLVTTGNFWANEAKDLAMAKAAKAVQVLFIPLFQLDIKENKSSIGAIVKGDDGSEHSIDHTGVANHPGDLGMKRIAETIFSQLP
ncbi:hypothetical protein GCM10028807_10240 [Spirosoma daeguense]